MPQEDFVLWRFQSSLQLVIELSPGDITVRIMFQISSVFSKKNWSKRFLSLQWYL